MSLKKRKIQAEDKERLRSFLHVQQQSIWSMFERVEASSHRVESRCWKRRAGGGGKMGVLRGNVVEKGACNVSEVFGESYPEFQEALSQVEAEQNSIRSGRPFYATGLSSIVHMYNPYAPIAHLNVRYIEVGDESWFGGGADLTPMVEFEEDTVAFHNMLRSVCENHHPEKSAAYKRYAQQCEDYFYITHRREQRGVGGIFFDKLYGSYDVIFPFIEALVVNYMNVLEEILERRKHCEFDAKLKEDQLFWRARYAEFNLVYDRGTQFGLKSGGDFEAIFVSLPPVVKW